MISAAAILPEGTSMTAPVASGWSDLAGWDSRPLESAALSRLTMCSNNRGLAQSIQFLSKKQGRTRAHRRSPRIV
jgi:hypothetical protein